MNFSLYNFSGLLLDFDGTLANTEPLHDAAMKQFFASKGIEKGKDEPGKSTLHIFREWGQEIGDSAKAERYLVEYLAILPQFFRDNSDQAQWQPDTLNFLQSTVAMKRAVVTSSFRSWLDSFEPQLHISNHFQHFVTKDDVLPDHEKPDPLPYTLGVKKLHLAPEQCLAIEDSYSGITSAKRAGCFVVAIKRDQTTGFEIADLVVSSLSELFSEE